MNVGRGESLLFSHTMLLLLTEEVDKPNNYAAMRKRIEEYKNNYTILYWEETIKAIGHGHEKTNSAPSEMAEERRVTGTNRGQGEKVNKILTAKSHDNNYKADDDDKGEEPKEDSDNNK